MRNAARVICLTFVLIVAMMLPSEPTSAAPFKKDVQIKLDLTGAVPEIFVDTPGDKFIGLCKKWNPAARKHCRGNEINWQLVIQGAGGLSAGEEVRIVNAPDHPVCFGTDPVVRFDDTTPAPLELSSGPPADDCSKDKYGTYWPYVIEFWKDGFLQASTDPGGVIFP